MRPGIVRRTRSQTGKNGRRPSDSLVFKGGTALKKCYFDNYRFSEDLDFSGLEGTSSGVEMAELVGRCVRSPPIYWMSTIL